MTISSVSQTTEAVSPCYLYIFRVHSGAIKIGVTDNLENRYRTAQTNNYEELEGVFSIVLPSRDAAFTLESALHRRYKEHCIRNEWFKLDPQEVIRDIEFVLSVVNVFQDLDIRAIRIPKLKPHKVKLENTGMSLEQAAAFTFAAGQFLSGEQDFAVPEEPEPEPQEEQGDPVDKLELRDAELYQQAIGLVMRLDMASVSLLQRRLRIGYSRAARMIDRMEASGIVGSATQGSKPRKVLIKADQTVDFEQWVQQHLITPTVTADDAI